jgi:sodium transport system ATP-binding protein
MIEVEHLGKTFNGITAVKDLSFTAPDAAITGLLGANGAGKTTTLRMISGVLKPQKGEVRIDNAPSSGGIAGGQRNLGALLDHTGLYARLTARENLTYFGQLLGIPLKRANERATEVLSLLGMQSLAERRTAGFSQGERMKVALGRAMLHSPGNLVLDEPTNGLDVPTVRSLRALLRRLRDGGTCVIFSSHVLEEVGELCDNVVIVARGSLAAQGSPEELCRLAETPKLEDAFVKLTNSEEARPC